MIDFFDDNFVLAASDHVVDMQQRLRTICPDRDIKCSVGRYLAEKNINGMSIHVQSFIFRLEPKSIADKCIVVELFLGGGRNVDYDQPIPYVWWSTDDYPAPDEMKKSIYEAIDKYKTKNIIENLEAPKFGL